MRVLGLLTNITSTFGSVRSQRIVSPKGPSLNFASSLLLKVELDSDRKVLKRRCTRARDVEDRLRSGSGGGTGASF